MANVPVFQLKYGDKLLESVQTQLGGTLFQKGKIVNQKDIDIMKAFLIQNVAIEPRAGEQATKSVVEETKALEEQTTTTPFAAEYQKMLQLLKKVYSSADSSTSLPILELRQSLEALISQIGQYNILTFSQRNTLMEDYLYHNSIKTSLTSYLLAKWHGHQLKDLVPIALSGLLHDIGNVRIDHYILQKPGKLTSEELEEVKKHAIIGYNMIKNVPGINEGVKLCTLQHHEREDGSGYPLGIKGKKIHPYAKVVAIADIYHAMSSSRKYKAAASPYVVLEQLQHESFGKLDPALVQTFIYKVTQFHNGMLVKLSDNSIGEIVFSDRTHPTRPWVNVNGLIINLTTERKLHIQEIVKF